MPFKTTKFDWIVFLIVSIVFLYAFFVLSFHPMRDDNGNIIYDLRHNPYVEISLQTIIAPLIITYEMIVLVLLEGKRRGRELPWRLYFFLVKEMTKSKFRDGIKEYKEWRQKDKKK